jgi:hypothetical protein
VQPRPMCGLRWSTSQAVGRTAQGLGVGAFTLCWMEVFFADLFGIDGKFAICFAGK